MLGTAAQSTLAARQRPLPGEPRRRQAGPRQVPVAVRRCLQGRRADAEHPADGLRLVGARPGVGQVDEGQRRDEGREVPSPSRPATSPTRSASSPWRRGGRSQARRVRLPAHPRDVSSTRSRTAAQDRRPRPRLVGPLAARGPALLRHAGARHQDRPALRSSTRSASGPSSSLASRRPLARRSACSRWRRRYRRRLPARGAAALIPLEVPDPGDGLPDRLPGLPIIYTSTSRSPTTRRVTSSRRARRSRRSRRRPLEQPANGKTYTMAPRRAGREPRAHPPGRRDRQVLRRHEGRA